MLATAKNYDVVFLQMRTYMPYLDPLMKKELNNFMAEIEAGLISNKKMKPFIDSILPKVFNFRVKAIKWLIEEERLDLFGVIDEIYPQLEELKQNPKLEILVENILFAIRCNEKVVQRLIASNEFSGEDFASDASKLQIITYSQFLATLAFSIPDDSTAQKIVDWVNASLYIELVILSAVIIQDKKLKINNRAINELSFLIADAAQEYSAIATELETLNPSSESHAIISEEIDKSFIKEQTYLAEIGMNDFAKNM